MIKDVIIEIKTEQSLDGQSDSIEFSTDGRFGIKDGSYFLSYDESGLLDDDPCPIAGAVSITQKDVQDLFEETFHPSRYSLSVVLPTEWDPIKNL